MITKLLYHSNHKVGLDDEVVFHVEADSMGDLLKAIQQFRAFEKLNPTEDEKPPLHES